MTDAGMVFRVLACSCAGSEFLSVCRLQTDSRDACPYNWAFPRFIEMGLIRTERNALSFRRRAALHGLDFFADKKDELKEFVFFIFF